MILALSVFEGPDFCPFKGSGFSLSAEHPPVEISFPKGGLAGHPRSLATCENPGQWILMSFVKENALYYIRLELDHANLIQTSFSLHVRTLSNLSLGYKASCYRLKPTSSYWGQRQKLSMGSGYLITAGFLAPSSKAAGTSHCRRKGGALVWFSLAILVCSDIVLQSLLEQFMWGKITHVSKGGFKTKGPVGKWNGETSISFRGVLTQKMRDTFPSDWERGSNR